MNSLSNALGVDTQDAIQRVRRAIEQIDAEIAGSGEPMPPQVLADRSGCPLLGAGGSRIALDLGGGWVIKVPLHASDAEINVEEWVRTRDLQGLPWIPETHILKDDLLLMERLIPLDLLFRPTLAQAMGVFVPPTTMSFALAASGGPFLPPDLLQELQAAQRGLWAAMDERGIETLIDPDYAFNWGVRTPQRPWALKVLDLGG